MRIEDSAYLKGMEDYAIRKTGTEWRGTIEATADFFDECIEHADSVWPQWHKRTKKDTKKQRRYRVRQSRRLKRDLQKTYSQAFRAFDVTLAAAAFVNRSLVEATFAKRPIPLNIQSCLGVDGIAGGQVVKHVLLIGMHARMVSIGSEISFLLRAGFPEGAAARSRTLYEQAIKAIAIAGDPTSDLAERYYVSAQLEGTPKTAGLDEQDQVLLRRARHSWGDSFFKGDNNWALPIMPKGFTKPRVTFRDLEDAVHADDLRHMYLECNEAVHAGPSQIIRNTDFKNPYLFTTQAKVDLFATGRVGQASVFYLELATLPIVDRLARELQQWDYMLHATHFMTEVQLTNRLFYKGYKGLRS